MIKILVDGMGGDNAPYATVAGSINALNSDKDLHIILAGRESELKNQLSKYSYDTSRLEILDYPEIIAMSDSPTESLRRKNTSLIGGFYKLKEDESIHAFVTAGSTGATIVGGQLILGRLRGVKRPALCGGIPNSRGGITLLLDCGANAECKPIMLCQFALLGSAYAKIRLNIQNPKVGLLNNGTEEHKGDPLRQETYKYLSQIQGINFIGNVEGRDIMIGDCDVVVTDGFSGNIALKSIEGCGKLILNELKTQFKSSITSKIGYLFMRKSIKKMRSKLDFEKIGGAILIGLKKPVIKSHGASKPETITKSILNAADICRGNLIPAVEEMLQQVNFENFSVGENDA